MIQDLFVHIHQAIEELENEFKATEGIEEELILLEKYLSVKELSEDLSDELHILQQKLVQFEQDHGLNEEHSSNSNENVVIELDEEDFSFFQKGIGFYDLWMYDQALGYLQQVINKYPDFNLARLYTAMTYLKSKRYSEAKQETLTMFKSTDDNDLISLGYNILGIVESNFEKYSEAEFNFKQAINLKEKWHEPKFNLAIVYYKTNKLIDSIKLFRELLTTNHQDFEVLLYLGKAYKKLKMHDDSNEFFKKAYTITKQPIIIKQIAGHFEQIRKFTQAASWYKRWLIQEPQSLPALIGYARSLWLDGNKNQGLLVVKKALTLDSNNLEASLIYAWMLTDLNDKNAVKIIEHLVDLNDSKIANNYYIIANLARLYSLHQDKSKSNKFNAMLLSSSNSIIRGLGNIVEGLIDLDQNNPEEAISRFEKSLVEGCSFPFLNFYLGYGYYLLENKELATIYWNKLIEETKPLI